jgi:hypothetical protein
MTEISLESLEQIRNNPKVRRQVAFEDPLWFALLYLQQHFKYPFAPFHLEMFELIRQTEEDFIVVIAFRESGKSTILNMANVLWSILGKPNKKFVIILSQTQEQAKNHFANIKHELENNELLREDFGPFTENEKDWNKLSLELEYHGSKIISLIRDQSIRGLKYNQNRPDLIICDDLEDTTSVKDEAQRKALYYRFQSEIIPLGNEKTRIVVLGNLLSFFWGDSSMDDALILKLRMEILTGATKGMFRAYPMLDDCGKNLWPGRFPNLEATMKLRSKMSKRTWVLEYLLKSYGQDNEDAPNVHFDYGDDSTRKSFGLWSYVPEDGDICLVNAQKPLVKQMSKYIIRVPAHTMAFFQRADDPKYRKYLKNLCFYKDKKDMDKRIAEDIKKHTHSE